MVFNSVDYYYITIQGTNFEKTVDAPELTKLIDRLLQSGYDVKTINIKIIDKNRTAL